MTRDERAPDELRSLMEKALHICRQLQNYTGENFDAFTSDDDERIIEVLNHREEFIEALAGIENGIDMILDGAGEHALGKALPPEVDEMWRSVRAVLTEIAAADMEIMKLLSSKMQLYRDETLKARSKQNLSAYMRSAAYIQEPGDSINLSN